jgi:methyltransferase-like protein/cyclopropane fatty-acyl-phospholipid synthase-like methyltransferase
MPGAPNCSYDELPYDSQFFVATHPDRMAVMATLHGMTPPPVEACRVLELGCANGGNLLPMAQGLPGSRFVGVDLSPTQINAGRAIVDRLGFSNVRLEARGILEIDDDFGTFDYIVCHGVYSWVAEEVRRKILAICARNLAPNGVAYVSYNTYPGWHLRGMVREMLLYHTRGFAEPSARVLQARAFLDFLIRTAPDPDGAYARVLGQEAKLLEGESDTYIFHEHLEDENHPIYFSEFVAEAGSFGLKYLAPARFGTRDHHLAPEVREVLDRLGTDRVRREQYLDFVMNRTFRQSLLCRANVAAREAPRPEALGTLRLTANARPTSEAPDVRSEAPEQFVAISGERVTTARPMLKAALVGLYRRWPRSECLDELWGEVRSLLGRPEGDFAEFAEGLLQAHVSHLVTLHTHEPLIACEAGERPMATPLARLQAEGDTFVVNLRFQNVELGELDALILRLLDGTRDRPAILAGLEEFAADGTLTIERDDRPISDPERLRAFLADAIEPSLACLAWNALLLES